MFCHGIGVKSGGLLPDLRRAPRDVYAPTRWQAIVISGVRADRGMPSFAGSLSREDAEAIRAYVISQAQRRKSVLEQGAAWLYDVGTCVPASWVAD
jgi:mono/diheme cytochrome c family protein